MIGGGADPAQVAEAMGTYPDLRGAWTVDDVQAADDMAMDYEAACRKAATDQGLDPLTAALGAAGVGFAVEQTGGFCMAVTVPAEDGTWAVTDDGCWYLGWYQGDAWSESGFPDHEVELPSEALDVVVRTVRSAPVR